MIQPSAGLPRHRARPLPRPRAEPLPPLTRLHWDGQRAADLSEPYAAALQEYCLGGGEAALLKAYELGRRAVREGLGVLRVASVHEALLADLLDRPGLGPGVRLAKRASEFFAECLASFELARHGLEDVSATLRELNQGLRRSLDTAQQQLLEQKRLEELKNDFICIISHEVRTPLTSIHGALTLLKAGLGGDLDEQGRTLLDVAVRNSQRLVRLVTDSLDLQKVESGAMTFKLRSVELRPFLRQAVEANRAYAGQLGVTLALGHAPRSGSVRADPDRLMQVMANLLSNAAKFSPADRPVVVEAARRGRLWRISVHDEGPGIPKEFQHQVFQKFAQAEGARDKGGSGLGLSISKANVERLGGHIEFRSAPGLGTTFYVDLPEGRTGRAV